MRITADSMFNFSTCRVFTEPFKYFLADKAFDRGVSLLLLEWLESHAPWKLIITDFYEQYEFNFLDVRLPSHLFFLQEQAFLDDIKGRMERVFGVNLSPRVDLSAHKLIPSQRVRLHNDFIPGQETHRLLIQLNRGWTDEKGGLLVFFNSSNPADVHRLFLPVHNSVVGFAISPDSNHAVSTVYGGERLTLVYSFHERVCHA